MSPEVMKYMGITETTDMASGWSMDDHKMACLEIYKQRYGNAFDFYSCYEYLKNKNKFSAFRTKCEEVSLGKRPIGKKKARQAEAYAKLVKAIISEVVVKKEKKLGGSDSVVSAFESSGESGGVNSNSGGAGAMMGDVLQNISSVIVNVGTAFLENMKAEQDMRFYLSHITLQHTKCSLHIFSGRLLPSGIPGCVASHRLLNCLHESAEFGVNPIN